MLRRAYVSADDPATLFGPGAHIGVYELESLSFAVCPFWIKNCTTSARCC